jgi:hypothetical protein
MLVIELADVPCCLANRQAGAELGRDVGRQLDLDILAQRRIYAYMRVLAPILTGRSPTLMRCGEMDLPADVQP